MVHIMHNIREVINITNSRDDIKLNFTVDHAYKQSARRFLGYAFPDKRDRGTKFIIKVKGHSVYTWMDLQCPRLPVPGRLGGLSSGNFGLYRVRSKAYNPFLDMSKGRFKAQISLGWTTEDCNNAGAPLKSGRRCEYRQ